MPRLGARSPYRECTRRLSSFSSNLAEGSNAGRDCPELFANSQHSRTQRHAVLSAGGGYLSSGRRSGVLSFPRQLRIAAIPIEVKSRRFTPPWTRVAR